MKKGFRKRKQKEYMKYMIIGCVVIVAIVALVFGIRSCGVSHRSPEHVVEDLIKSAVKGKTDKMADCYWADKKGKKLLQKEIKADVAYYKAHEASKVEITDCKNIYEEKKYSYVYIIFNLVLENEEKYPCIRTYMVENKNEEYFVLPSSVITEEMSKRAAQEYAQFMTTDAYKDYVNAYDTFTKKNPGYEEKIAGKIG